MSWRRTAAALVLFGVGCATIAGAAETGGAAMQAMDRTGLVLELLLDGKLEDSSGTGHALTPHGELGFLQGWRTGSANFAGTSWIDTGVSQAELGEEFTVECYVCPADQQSQYADLFGNHVSEGLGFVVQQDGRSTNDVYAAYGAGGGRWVMTEALPLLPRHWQHVALVKTREELRLCLNGVPAALRRDPAPAPPSPLPIRVGLGYTDPARCFRGQMAEFRIWKRALSAFPHAGIDPAAALAVRALGLETTPRPLAGPLLRSWGLATADTRLTLGVTAAGELVLSELVHTTTGHNWVAAPVAIGLLPGAEVGGDRLEPRWALHEAAEDRRDGQTLTLRLATAQPALDVTSRWEARPGPGPVRHTLIVTNRSDRALVVRGQPTFDLDLTGASDLWSFHSDGMTPDPVGVYRRSLGAADADRRHTLRTAPGGEFIPYVVLDAGGRHGVYLGLEWSFCRIEAVPLTDGRASTVRLRAGAADRRIEIDPGETVDFPPGFIGAYAGDLDDAGNRLRRWLFRHCVPGLLRTDAGYPKVQWNAFGATGRMPGSWDPVEAKFYPLIDDIAPLGFEEVMIDVGWWEGREPNSDQVDWPSGMRRAAEYAQAKGLRFGLYWTDDLDMANAEARARRAGRIRRLFQEYRADMWRSDCTRGEVIGASYAATRGFYAMVDGLAAQVPGFQWENCSGGGRIKDYGAMRRAVKIFNSDTYSALHVRQAFYDSSYALHPAQLEGHLGSTDGRFRPQGVAGMRFAFRSAALGAPEWFIDAPSGGNGTEPWTQEERDTVRACVELYKARIRPLVRAGDLYHILPRPDGRRWDGIEYYDPELARGLVFLFKPDREASTQSVRLRGLDAAARYSITFADGSNPPTIMTGAELLSAGLSASLPPGEVSELVFLERVR